MADEIREENEMPPLPRIDWARCTGCALCVKVCPNSALAMRGGFAVVSRPDACEYRGECERICPTQAITRTFKIIFAPRS